MPAKGSGPEMLGPPSPQQPCRCRARALRPRAAPCPWSHVARRARAKRHARRAPGAAVHAAVSGEGRCVSGAGRRAAEAGGCLPRVVVLEGVGDARKALVLVLDHFLREPRLPADVLRQHGLQGARRGGEGAVRRRGEPRLERGVATRGVEVSLGPVVLGHKDRRDNVRVGPEEVSPAPAISRAWGGDAVGPCEVCGSAVGGARSAPRRPAGGEGGARRGAHSLKRILSTSLSQFSMPAARACTSGGCTRVAGTGSAAGTHRRPVALRASGGGRGRALRRVLAGAPDTARQPWACVFGQGAASPCRSL